MLCGCFELHSLAYFLNCSCHCQQSVLIRSVAPLGVPLAAAFASFLTPVLSAWHLFFLLNCAGIPLTQYATLMLALGQPFVMHGCGSDCCLCFVSHLGYGICVWCWPFISVSFVCLV